MSVPFVLVASHCNNGWMQLAHADFCGRDLTSSGVNETDAWFANSYQLDGSLPEATVVVRWVPLSGHWLLGFTVVRCSLPKTLAFCTEDPLQRVLHCIVPLRDLDLSTQFFSTTGAACGHFHNLFRACSMRMTPSWAQLESSKLLWLQNVVSVSCAK